MAALRVLAIALLILSLWPDRDDETRRIAGDQVLGASTTPTPAGSTSETDLEPDEILDASIREGIALALTRFDVETHLPGWSVEPVNADNTGAGSTLLDTKAIFISATIEQTPEDIATTVLHEIGHVLDATQLDDRERQAFRALRGHPAEVPWTRPVGQLPADGRWLNSAEDFAEVFVAWANGGDYVTQSRVLSAQPSSSDLAAFCSLIETVTISC